MKKLMLFILVGMFMISLASAADWDNCKTYDDTERKITVGNLCIPFTKISLGDKIAEIELQSDLDQKVAVGYQKVAQFKIRSYQDYDLPLKKLDLYNLKSDMQTVSRNVDYKYLSYEQVDVLDYEYQCVASKNESKDMDCSNVLVGSHMEIQERWNDLDTSSIPIGTITVGIFTNVEVGDHVEWVPEYFGVRIEEWAAWTQDLNVDLAAYYKFDATSGIVVDSTANGFDGTNNGATRGITGVIGNAFSFDGTNDFVNTGQAILNYTGFTISFWVNTTEETKGSYLVSQTATNSFNASIISQMINTGVINFDTFPPSGGSLSGSTQINDSAWHHVVLTRDGNNRSIYVDGVIDANDNSGETYTGSLVADYNIAREGDGALFMNATFDEMGLWNRTLNASEVTALYNGGAGITFPAGTLSAITPSDGSTVVNLLQTFTGNATSEGNRVWDNVSLVINDSAVSTNTSGIDGDYIFNYTLASIGSWNWSLLAITNLSEEFSSNTNTFTVSVPVMENCTEFNASSYLHIDFLDETALTVINASVSSATFEFWTIDPDDTQTFSFTHTAEIASYDFCILPSIDTYTVDAEFPYLSTGYPQRVYRADNAVLTNLTTNVTLYLLSSSDGFYTRYLAINSLTGSAIEGVEVTVQKTIGGTPVTIAQGTTDATGLITFWLDPDDLHDFTFIATGFQISQFSIRPSSPDTYQIAMVPSEAAEEAGNGTDINTGLFYEILPSQLTLNPNQTYTFSFNVSRTDGVDDISMELSWNETIFFSDTNVGNGIISTVENTTGNSSIMGSFIINLGNETLEFTRSWTVINITTGDFSLKAWLEYPDDTLIFDTLWWNLFRYLFMMILLLSIAAGFYYLDPLDSSSASLIAAIIVVWLFGSVGWLSINTPLGDTIDRIIIPSLFSMVMIAFMLWRYKSQ